MGPSVQDSSLRCFDPKSWDAFVQTGLEKFLDCDSGPDPLLHHSWDAETTCALEEGLEDQDVESPQNLESLPEEQAVELQRERPCPRGSTLRGRMFRYIRYIKFTTISRGGCTTKGAFHPTMWP